MQNNNAAKLLMDNKNSLCETKNAEGKTPLHIACENGNIEIIRLLLSYSDNVID